MKRVSCNKCGTNDNLVTYAMPDFIYRHRGQEILQCKDCGSLGPQYTDFHVYDPSSDNYFLGLSYYYIDWSYSEPNYFICFECSTLITTTKMGHGIALSTPDPTTIYSNVIPVMFCQHCTFKRKGVRLEDEYAESLDILYKRTDMMLLKYGRKLG